MSSLLRVEHVTISYNGKPVWDEKDQEWYLGDRDDKFLQVPKGTIRRLTGIFLQYIDDPIKIQ